MFSQTPTKKAKKQGRKAVKQAGKSSKKATKKAEKAGREAQERAAHYAEVASEAAADLAERIRHSDGIAKAQAKGVQMAGAAKEKWHDSDLEDRLEDFTERVASSETAKKAQEKTKEVTDTSLAALGEWLHDSKTGKEIEKKLGVRKRSRWRMLIAGAVGVAAGFAIARLVQPQPLPELTDDFGPDQFGQPAGQPELADSIRAALSADERTAELDQLSVNVADSTAFVRGTVPEGTDESVVRDVVASVPGVSDVDLELTPAATTS